MDVLSTAVFYPQALFIIILIFTLSYGSMLLLYHRIR